VRPLQSPLARLVAKAELADPSLRLHSHNVARISLAIGRALYLPQRMLAMLVFAAAVHDIGKVAVSSSVLAKPGPLEAWERLAIQRHPAEGQRLLKSHVNSPELLAIVRSHHERWDGDGYPDGLAAEQIPLGARIVAVADAFTAMVEPRPYRRASQRRSRSNRTARPGRAPVRSHLCPRGFLCHRGARRGGQRLIPPLAICD
jgi:HD-GYP domain-containing protein (c-di-GMP phosphodiesterase class II)